MLVSQGRTVRSRRKAAAAIWALLTLTTMLTALALALNTGWLCLARQELSNAADASALAGVHRLIDDAWLRDGKPGIFALLDRVNETAGEFAARNRVLGQPVQLDTTGFNIGDVVLGSYDPREPGVLERAELEYLSSLTLDEVNTVAVTAIRGQQRQNPIPILLGPLVLQASAEMRISSLAYLDRDVIGFRARIGSPVPFVPIAVRSDPTAADTSSWESQIRQRQGPDEYKFNPVARIFILGSDQIPEIVLEIPLELGPGGLNNAVLLSLGRESLATQIVNGLSERDLRSRQGKLVLDENNQLSLPAQSLGPAHGSAEYLDLFEALKNLQNTGVQKVWPLYTQVQGNQAIIHAFVAARVVRVEAPVGGPLRLRLQPTMMAVPQAITDFSRRGTAHLLPSDYLAKPTLVH